jgi:hypothetical protein
VLLFPRHVYGMLYACSVILYVATTGNSIVSVLFLVAPPSLVQAVQVEGLQYRGPTCTVAKQVLLNDAVRLVAARKQQS